MAWEITVSQEKRLCKVKGEYGYFHTWAHVSQPIEASPLIGGAPAGLFSRVYGIVEFADNVRYVETRDIVFCDEDNGFLQNLNHVNEDDLK